MIHTFDLKVTEFNSIVGSQTVLSCDTELDKEILSKELFGVHKLDITSFPNAGDYREMSNDEIREYISDYYEEVLSKLDPEEVIREIRFTALVSDERTDSLAKRHIISEWLNLHTNEKICETGIELSKDCKLRYVELERPEFIKPMLEEVIKTSKLDMRGFQSLRALYLFEKGERLEALADKLEKKHGGSYDDYRKLASYYRSEADTAEEKYKMEMAKSKTKSYSSQRKYVRTSK